MSWSPPAWEAAFDDDDEFGSASSTMFTETATGWHVLKVEGYCQINGLLGVARHLKSCPVVVGGHTWCITYFPDGLSEDTADWISFALRLECRAGEEDVTVRAKFTLLDDDGDPVPSLAASYGGVCTFSRVENRSVMELRAVHGEEGIRVVLRKGRPIQCKVRRYTVVEEDCGRLSAAAAPSPDLHLHLGELLASGDGADVTLVVGGEAFAAHRSMLAARSPELEAVFFGGPHKESGATRLSIRDVEPSVFRALLHFIYTDSFPDDIDNGDRTAMAQHLFVAADRYGVERLKSICEYVLCRFVDASAVVTRLVLALQHGCHLLKEACFKIILKFHKELMVGHDFRYLASTCPSLLQEVIEWGEIFENVDLKQQDR